MTATIPAVPLMGQPRSPRCQATIAPTAASNQALPVSRLAARSDRSVVYGLAAVDGRGRLANGAVLAALAWRSSVRLDIQEIRGLILISATANGRHRLTLRGTLPCRAVSGGGAVWRRATASCWLPNPPMGCLWRIRRPRWMRWSPGSGRSGLVVRAHEPPPSPGDGPGRAGRGKAPPGQDGNLAPRPGLVFNCRRLWRGSGASWLVPRSRACGTSAGCGSC